MWVLLLVPRLARPQRMAHDHARLRQSPEPSRTLAIAHPAWTDELLRRSKKTLCVTSWFWLEQERVESIRRMFYELHRVEMLFLCHLCQRIDTVPVTEYVPSHSSHCYDSQLLCYGNDLPASSPAMQEW